MQVRIFLLIFRGKYHGQVPGEELKGALLKTAKADAPKISTRLDCFLREGQIWDGFRPQ